MMKNAEIVEANFVKPYAQQALGGALGLTSEEAARGMHMQHSSLKRQFREAGYMSALKDAGFDFERIRTKSSPHGPGRPKELYVFPVATVKALLAQTRTKVGLCYLRWLFRCEEAVGKMAEAIKQERERVNELLDENERLKKNQRRRNRHALTVEVNKRTIFGIETEKVKKMLTIDEMDAPERRQWRALHCTRIAQGAAATAVALQAHEIEPDAVTMRQPVIRKEVSR